MAELRGLILRLADAEFPFVVVGGYATAAHGAALVTMDLDVCCEFTEESLARLRKALDGLHPVHRMRPDRMPLEITPGFSRGLKNFYLDTDLGMLDLLGQIAGIGGYTDALARSMDVEIGGRKVRMITLDGIIAAKEAMDRPRDREAAAQLRAIRDGSGKAD